MELVCSRAGSEVAANPFANGVTAIPSASAARRAISWPLHQTLTGYGAYAHTLMNAGPKCRHRHFGPYADRPDMPRVVSENGAEQPFRQ